MSKLTRRRFLQRIPTIVFLLTMPFRTSEEYKEEDCLWEFPLKLPARFLTREEKEQLKKLNNLPRFSAYIPIVSNG